VTVLIGACNFKGAPIQCRYGMQHLHWTSGVTWFASSCCAVLVISVHHTKGDLLPTDRIDASSRH
jgi:hypothetical protein